MDSSNEPEQTGRLTDEQKEAEEATTADGAAAEGDYDPAQGSPGGQHPVGEDFPDEAVRYDEPEARHRADPQE